MLQNMSQFQMSIFSGGACHHTCCKATGQACYASTIYFSRQLSSDQTPITFSNENPAKDINDIINQANTLPYSRAKNLPVYFHLLLNTCIIIILLCQNCNYFLELEKIQMTLTTILECLEEWEAPPCGDHLKLYVEDRLHTHFHETIWWFVQTVVEYSDGPSGYQIFGDNAHLMIKVCYQASDEFNLHYFFQAFARSE